MGESPGVAILKLPDPIYVRVFVTGSGDAQWERVANVTTNGHPGGQPLALLEMRLWQAAGDRRTY